MLPEAAEEAAEAAVLEQLRGQHGRRQPHVRQLLLYLRQHLPEPLQPRVAHRRERVGLQVTQSNSIYIVQLRTRFRV